MADDLDFFADDEATQVVGAMAPGSFFGDRFKIKGSLGAGSMGAVFEAADLQEGSRAVAVKVLLKGDASEKTRQRFQREYEILEAIDHPGIVQIYGYGYDSDGKTPWLAMEKLEGETLRQRVKRKGPMSAANVSVILMKVAKALEAAHAKGVVHRDLKPDHVFLLEDGGVRLIDFGLSLMRDSKKLTATGTVIGTPRYMAPEQIASAHNSGAPADVYALGVVIYEALVGDSPFAASDHGQLLGAILSGRRTPLAEVRPELDFLDESLNKAMAPKVEDRFQTPVAFANTFAAAIEPDTLGGDFRSRDSGELKDAPAARAQTTATSGDGRFWLMLFVGVLASAAIGAALTYFLLRSGS
ncbi:MAG: serine/threonine-protein kinase [Myxococcota bacterium]